MKKLICFVLVSTALSAADLRGQAAGSGSAAGTGGGAAGPANGGAAGRAGGGSAGNPIGSAGPGSGSDALQGGQNDIITGAPGFRANDREINSAGTGGGQVTPSVVERSLPESGLTPAGAATPGVPEPYR